MTPELQSKVGEWRQKALAGTLTQDEMRDAITFLRSSRVAAAKTSAASKERKAAKAPVDADALLNELEGL
jgi:ribosomal protein L12E/L44/L45/RPP1/RPP2